MERRETYRITSSDILDCLGHALVSGVIGSFIGSYIESITSYPATLPVTLVPATVGFYSELRSLKRRREEFEE